MIFNNIIQSLKNNLLLWTFVLLSIGSVTYAATKSVDTTVYSFVNLETEDEYTGTREAAKTQLQCPFDNGTICSEAYAEGHAGNPAMRIPSADLYKN